MSGSDPFRDGQEAAEAHRRRLEATREELQALVRDEVGRAGMSEQDLEALVGELVRSKHAALEANGPPVWRAPAYAAAGALIGLLVGAFGYRALLAPDASLPAGGAPAFAAEDSAGAADPGAARTETAAPDPATEDPPLLPERMAALYDSLFAARSDRFDPLVGALEGAAPAAPVTSAIEAWRGGAELTSAQERRLHDGLVQHALNLVAGSGLTLDGLISRGPCGGKSCGALLQLWQNRGAELGLPPFPTDPAAREAGLAVVERALVLREMGGGSG